MLVLAMSIGMAAAAMVITVIATVVAPTITTIIVIALVAHVVAQCTARATACSRADQCTCATADTAAYDVAAGCAQGAANSGFATAALVSADRTTTCATEGRADGRTGVAAQLLADDRT